MIAAVDSLEIEILVDNTTDMLSSTPAGVESESARLFRRGGRMTAGRCYCCAAHGLSCLITARRGSTSKTVLFDTGPEEYAFERNVSRLGISLGSVDAIVLSHGHWDHAGALLLALQMIRMENGGKIVPFYGHPHMFGHRAVKLPNGEHRLMEEVPNPVTLANHGADVILERSALGIADDMVFVSGEIPRKTSFERGHIGQVRRTAEGGWENDEPLIDERWIGIDVKGKGLVVLSACSHAGIVNVLIHAKERFPSTPIHAVIGGLHLSGPNEAVIPQTVEGIKPFAPKLIGAGHCTGWRAIAALSNAFGDQVLAPSAVGKRYSF